MIRTTRNQGASRMPSAIRLRGTLAAITLLALSGCIGLGGKPPKQLISLSPATSAQVGPVTTGTMADAIVVLNPETDRSLDMLRVPVRVDAATIAYLKDVAWVEKPAHQFRSLLSETLRAKTGRLVVEDGDFDTIGRTLVSGRLLAMGYDAQSHSVVVRVEMQRQEKNGAVTSRRFEAVEANVDAKAAPVAQALGTAANDVAGQVADWVLN